MAKFTVLSIHRDDDETAFDVVEARTETSARVKVVGRKRPGFNIVAVFKGKQPPIILFPPNG